MNTNRYRSLGSDPVPGSGGPQADGDRPDPRGLLLRAYGAALGAVGGRAAVDRALAAAPLPGPAWVIALGKAASAMTLGAIDHLGARCRGGLVIDKTLPPDPGPFSARGIEVLTGGHPVPTATSLMAGRRLLGVLEATPPGAGLLFLLSGGASSLAEVPAAGLGLADLERINRWLLASGLPIGSMNLVRTAVSRIKGGGLLAALPRRAVRVLAISDVPGDDPAVIGSGPLVPRADLGTGLAGLTLPPWLDALVGRALAERPSGTTAGPPIEIVANLGLAMAAAAAAGRTAGLPVQVHPEFIAGDAAARGRALARELRASPPGLHVWGGETTVCLPEHPGRGGRNQHLALAAALELTGCADCWLLAAGTDGSDGPGEDAGALVDGGTLARAAAAGRAGDDCLARADSGTLLAAAGDLIRTGPTGTNVMDLVLGLRSPGRVSPIPPSSWTPASWP